MKQKPNFVKDNKSLEANKTQPSTEIKPQEIINQRSKTGEGFEINYIVIIASDPISLATAVNKYMDKFPFMLPVGGICFISDNGKNEVCQSMANKDLKML